MESALWPTSILRRRRLNGSSDSWIRRVALPRQRGAPVEPAFGRLYVAPSATRALVADSLRHSSTLERTVSVSRCLGGPVISGVRRFTG